MKFLLDLIMVLILILCVIIGYRKGFFKVILSLAVYLLSAYFSWLLSGPIGGLIYDKMMQPKIVESVSAALEKAGTVTAEALPTAVRGAAGLLGVNLNSVLSDAAGSQTAQQISDLLRPTVVQPLKMLLTVLLFLILSLVLGVVAKMLNKLIRVSFLGGINHFFGAVAGLGNGLVFCCLFCLLCSFLVSFTENGFAFITEDALKNSYFYGILSKIWL